LLPVPDGVDLASAGGFAEAFTTVYDAFSFAGTMAADCRVLISGAAGGVGSAAVQLAHAWGAHPIGVTRDNRFHQRLLDLGAAEVTVVDDVDQLEPVDFVLELIGAAHFVHAQKVLAPHASVVVIGVSGGSRIELDLLRLMTLRVRMTGSTLRSRSNDEKSVVASGVRREVLPWWSNGAVTVPISANFGIDDVASAYDAFATAGKFGKIVLSMS
jgi:NADPH:quinone reductase-like Zn-dependent oxidoreductase